MSNFMLSGVIVGLIAIMFWTPALMAMGVSKFEGDLTPGERLICCIPLVNVIRAEYKYYGKLHMVSITSVSFAIVAVARIFIWWNFYDNVMLGTISVVAFWISLALWLIGNMVFVYNVIHDADALRGGKLILFSVAFPFGQYYVGQYLANVVRHMQAKEDTFKR